MTMQEKPKNENLAGKFADDCAEQLAKDDDWKGSEVTVRPWTSGGGCPADASCDSHDA
jgi:hypothetical protein